MVRPCGRAIDWIWCPACLEFITYSDFTCPPALVMLQCLPDSPRHTHSHSPTHTHPRMQHKFSKLKSCCTVHQPIHQCPTHTKTCVRAHAPPCQVKYISMPSQSSKHPTRTLLKRKLNSNLTQENRLCQQCLHTTQSQHPHANDQGVSSPLASGTQNSALLQAVR